LQRFGAWQLENGVHLQFFSFPAYCLHVTLRRRLRDLAPGLTLYVPIRGKSSGVG